MRDTSKGMIEILEAYEEDGLYFAVIEVPINDQREKFRFGVNLTSYKGLRKILQSRPLDTMPGVKYRYFYTGAISKSIDTGIVLLGIRYEVENAGKSFEQEVPQELAANLRWFSEIDTFEDAQHLKLKS